MSHPLWQTARMQSEDAAGPIEWDIAELKRSIEEWDGIAARILQLLDETASAAASQNWRPHATQIITVVRRFRALCEREVQQLRSCCEDGAMADEAYERVWDEADALVKWLGRMMQA
jgi:hypothetical protein